MSGSVDYENGEFATRVTARTSNPSATFTRPSDTTAYASGDLVANSTTAGSVMPMTFTVMAKNGGSASVLRARVAKSGATATNAAFYLYLFTALPTVTNGDNGALAVATNGQSYLGYLDIASLLAGGNGCGGVGAPAIGSAFTVKLTSGTALYGLLEARGAYTPASAEVFTVTLEAYQD